MARIRTIKPEFWKDEELSELPEVCHLFAAALLNYADDEGFFRVHEKLIKAELFPLREPSMSIHCMLTELSNINYIRLYDGTDGKKYGHIQNFLTHQRVNRPTPSKFKALIEFTEGSVSAHGGLTGERKGKEGKGKEGKGVEEPPATPPDPEREFPMHIGWKESDQFMNYLSIAGVPHEVLTAEARAEFISHWASEHKARHNQRKWENVFLKSLTLRYRSGKHRSPTNGQPESAADRFQENLRKFEELEGDGAGDYIPQF